MMNERIGNLCDYRRMEHQYLEGRTHQALYSIGLDSGNI